jgi:hypothetical protein
MKKFKVTMEMWRESFSGRDYRDGDVTAIVEAGNVESAIKKAKKKTLNPGKGMRWSQSIWIENSVATEIK